ncbi:hypothetical protein K3495_g7868 [Podosphaera aphanis]|nr:hypothetical protein K3495_g7868 [Podosphaera aphanis]
MQPMDAGIIPAFKRRYKSYYLQGAVDKFDQLTAMKWCLVARKEITALTISNCFKYTGLFKESITNQILEADELSIESELRDSFHQLRIQNAMSIANFLNPIEEDQGQVEELDDDQIIQMVQQPEEGEEEEEVAEEVPQISRAEKPKAIGTVVSLLDLSKEKYLDFFKRLRRIQHEIRCSTNTQITLDTWLI